MASRLIDMQELRQSEPLQVFDTTPQHQEAPVSVSVKGYYKGLELHFTVRSGATNVEISKAWTQTRLVVEQMLLDGVDGRVTVSRQAPAAEPEPPTPQPQAPQAQAVAQAVDVPMTRLCPIHGDLMKLRKADNGDAWYSHRVGDGWCSCDLNGQPRKGR